MEIGSIIEINPEDWGMTDEVENTDLVSLYQGSKRKFKDAAYVTCGREALELALLQLEELPEKACLLPAYTCDTVIIPFEHHGYKLNFYDVDLQMKPDEDNFCKMVEELRPSVILLHSYYGEDTLVNLRKYMEKWKEEGIVIIEDMTQSQNLISYIPIQADFYICTLRKWFALTDGALLLSQKMIRHKPMFVKKTFVNKKWSALTEKYLYLLQNPDACDEEAKKHFLNKNQEAEHYLYEDIIIGKMSELSKYLLNHIDIKESMTLRKENAKFLCRGLQNIDGVELPIIYDGTQAPIYVPIYVNDRDKAQKILQENKIFAPVLWEVPQQLLGRMGKTIQYIYEHMLALPCDQRYNLEDMTQILQGVQKSMNDKVNGQQTQKRGAL